MTFGCDFWFQIEGWDWGLELGMVIGDWDLGSGIGMGVGLGIGI